MASTRSLLGLATSLVLALAAAPALAQPAKQADQLNEQGKALLNAKPSRPAEATLKFRAAIVLSPEGRFYLNLCMSLYQEGKLGEALNMCRAVEGKGASAQQVKQAGTIVDKFILPKMREAGIDPDKPDVGPDPDNGTDPDPDNGTDPDPNNGTDPDPNNGTDPDPNNGTPDPNNGTPDPNNTGNTAANNFTVAPQPSLLDQTTGAGTHEYAWTLGAQLVGVSSRVGDADDYERGGGGIRIVSDFMINKPQKFGVQAYLTYFGVAGKSDTIRMGERIDVLDIGGAAYKEFCRGRMCLKPLAGLHVALIQPSDLEGTTETTSGFSTFGARAELGIEYALGARYENILTAGVGASLYFAAPDTDFDPEPYDLDRASANGYIGIGYTRRFSSPPGNQPLFTMQ